MKIDLSKEDKKWFGNYENGDTIYFSSQIKELDTFIVDVTMTSKYTTCNPFEIGPYIYAKRHISFESQDHYPVEKLDNNYFLGFDKENQDSVNMESIKCLGFFDLSTGKFFNFNKVPKQDFTIPKTGQKITLYIYTKNYNCSNQKGGTEVMQEFAISKEYGLIWYKTLKGDTYNRVW